MKLTKEQQDGLEARLRDCLCAITVIFEDTDPKDETTYAVAQINIPSEYSSISGQYLTAMTTLRYLDEIGITDRTQPMSLESKVPKRYFTQVTIYVDDKYIKISGDTKSWKMEVGDTCF